MTKICQISDSEVICFYDDGTAQLLGEDALMNSNNRSGTWLKHDFIGKPYLMAVDTKEDSTLVLLEKDACRVSFVRVNKVKACLDIIRTKNLERGYAYKLMKIGDLYYTVQFSEESINSIDMVDIC